VSGQGGGKEDLGGVGQEEYLTEEKGGERKGGCGSTVDEEWSGQVKVGSGQAKSKSSRKHNWLVQAQADS
jgi:hypothetical protein